MTRFLRSDTSGGSREHTLPDSNLLPLSPTHRRVLEMIWRRGPVPRHELADLTDLTTASITRLARDLETRGLVFDRVVRSGGRGQPVRPLSIVAEGAYALGVNFSRRYIDVGLVNMAGDLVAHERAELPAATPQNVHAFALKALPRLCGAAKVPQAKVVGAGFSVPGDFVAPNRLNAHAFFAAFGADVDLAAAFGEDFPMRVVVENDALSAAIGERVHGAGLSLDTFLFVHIGHGIGSGVILNGRPYRGAHGNAGIIGVGFPNDEPRPSGQDLFTQLSAAGEAIDDFDALETLDADHPVLRAWMARAGRQLARGLQIPVRVLDPKAVILGGRLPQHILEALYKEVNLLSVLEENAPLPNPQFLMSTLGPYAGVIGAASMCFFETFFASQ